jgi:hypothetical protein
MLVNALIKPCKGVATGGGEGASGASCPPCFWKFCFFWMPKSKKNTFSGVYSCSIYMNKDITPPLLLKFRYHRIYAPPCLGDPATPLKPCKIQTVYSILLFITVVFRFSSTFYLNIEDVWFDSHLNKSIFNYFSIVYLLLLFWFI